MRARDSLSLSNREIMRERSVVNRRRRVVGSLGERCVDEIPLYERGGGYVCAHCVRFVGVTVHALCRACRDESEEADSSPI